MSEIEREDTVQPFPSAGVPPHTSDPEHSTSIQQIADPQAHQESPEISAEAPPTIQKFPTSQELTASSAPSPSPVSAPGTNPPNITPTTSFTGRKRSNSQSQVKAIPTTQPQNSTSSGVSVLTRQRGEDPRKRPQVQYYVTLAPLNDTFTKKHLPVATFPETTKLGRPTGTKHKPDVTNGYFDSRVLSRNHAQIYIEPKHGKLMLQDLGSSNGTYLNDVRLTSDAVEIKVGDTVCLGFNVQAESTHKQISLKIDNINVIGTTNVPSKNVSDAGILFNKHSGLDSAEFKHLSFIEDIYKQVTKTDHPLAKQFARSPRSITEITAKPPQPVTFENALFGDINPNLEDNLLGLYSSVNSGIYNNSHLTNTGTLESTINILIMNLSKAKQQNQSLHTLETFFNNYQSQLKTINGKYLDTEFKKSLGDIQTDLKKQKLSNQKIKERAKASEEVNQKAIEKLTANLKAAELEKNKLSELVDQLQNDHKKELERIKQEEKTKELQKEIILAHIPQERLGTTRSDPASGRILLQDLTNKSPATTALETKDAKEVGNENGSSIDSGEPKKSVTTTQGTVIDIHGLFSDLNNGSAPNKFLIDNKEFLKDSSPTTSSKSLSPSLSPSPASSEYMNGNSNFNGNRTSHELTPPISDDENNHSQPKVEATEHAGAQIDKTPQESEPESKEAQGSTVTSSSQYESELESVESSLSVSNELNGASSLALALMVVVLGYLIKKLT